MLNGWFILAVLAILAALVAFVRIWITGDKGWGRAVIGFIIGAACLAPAGLLAADFLRYPVADEVTTDPLNPPPLLSAIVPVPPSAAVAARLAAAFPNLKPRTYPIDPATVFSIVGGLVARWAFGQSGVLGALLNWRFLFAVAVIGCHFVMNELRRNVLLRSLFFLVFAAATLACLFWSFTL